MTFAEWVRWRLGRGVVAPIIVSSVGVILGMLVAKNTDSLFTGLVLSVVLFFMIAGSLYALYLLDFRRSS